MGMPVNLPVTNRSIRSYTSYAFSFRYCDGQNEDIFIGVRANQLR